MKSSKIARRASALARFRVLPFNEWLQARTVQVNGKAVGVAASQQELLDEHSNYCERKAVERAALEKGN